MVPSFKMISRVGLMAMALSACASPSGNDMVVEVPVANGPPLTECTAAPAQSFIGKTADVANGTEIVRLTKSSKFRWIGPRTPVTMDYRYERVNISYDDNMVITQITCG